MNDLFIKGTKGFLGFNLPIICGGFGEEKRSLSDKTISEIHGMETKNVRARITDNIKRFKENVDFIDLIQRAYCTSTSEKQRMHETHTIELLKELGYAKQSITQAGHIYLLSERGYSKLIKIMDTDLAWEVHDKIMDEYFQMRDNQKPLSQLQIMQKSIEILNEHDGKIKEMDNRMDKLEYDIPLYGSEADELSNHVKRKGVAILGGKKSAAYQDIAVRSKVYRDIYNQIKREFGLYAEDGKTVSYKALKRKYIYEAHEFVDTYDAPLYLQGLINDTNALFDMTA